MSRPDDNSEEIPHLPDPRELYRQMEEEQSSDKAPLPDPAELFRQMEAEEKAEDEVADLPDPALLYQQMEEESYDFSEEDLGFEIPDPDSVDSGRTITVTLEELEARRNLEEAAPTEDAEVWEAEEPPDMAALLQASLSEVEEEPPEEEADSAVAELPDPAALFAELEEEDEDSADVDAAASPAGAGADSAGVAAASDAEASGAAASGATASGAAASLALSSAAFSGLASSRGAATATSPRRPARTSRVTSLTR